MGPEQLLIAAILGGTGLQAAGQIQAGRAAAAEGKSAQNIANYNAAIQEQQAKAIEAKASFDQSRQAEAGSGILGQLRASMGASGAMLGVGTPLSLESEQQAELDLQNLLIGFEGGTQAARARSQGTLDILGGELASERGKAAQKASYVSAAGTILTGFGTAAALKYKPPGTDDGTNYFARRGG